MSSLWLDVIDHIMTTTTLVVAAPMLMSLFPPVPSPAYNQHLNNSYSRPVVLASLLNKYVHNNTSKLTNDFQKEDI
jgi:hypothetical protein